MKHPNVTCLYHYKGLEATKSLLKEFKEKKFWAAKPASFNDPYDCSGGFGFKNMSRNGFEHICGTHIGKEENCRLQFEIQNVGVICFSERADSVLMWSHYADKHRGCCLKFKREENNCLGSKCCVPVHYSDMIDQVPFADYHKANESERFDMLVESYSVKAADWFYEREWRYFIRGGDELIEFNAKVEAIIFGERVEDKEIEPFVSADVDNRPFFVENVYKAELKDEYRIELKPIKHKF